MTFVITLLFLMLIPTDFLRANDDGTILRLASSSHHQNPRIERLNAVAKLLLSRDGIQDRIKAAEAKGADFSREEALLAALDTAINTSLKEVEPWSKTLQYGLLGKDRAEYFEAIDVDDPCSMVGLAVLYETLSSLRKPMEKRLERSGEAIWGVVETPIISLYNGARELWYEVFHKGRRPFNVSSVMNLRDEALDAMLKGLGAASAECIRTGPKGRDTVHRNVMEGLMTEMEQAEEVVITRDRLWTRLTEGYSRDIDRIALKLECHKRYYAEIARTNSFGMEQDIVDLTTRVQESLTLIKEEILQPALSLRDIASGDNRLLFDHLIKDIARRFELLINVLNSYHLLSEEKESLRGSAEKASHAQNNGGPRGGFAG